VRFSDLLVFNRFSVVASPYSSITLNADYLWDFDVTRPDHYDLFNARYVVAPSAVQAPAFLVPLRRTARYVLYEVPTSGYTEFATATTRETANTQVALFSSNRDWVRSSEPGARRFIHWDYPRVTPTGADPTGACGNADLRYERASASRIEALAACREAASLVFKVTYHPNWRVWVDDREVSTFMASPSYLAVSVPPGEHFVRAAYESTPLKTPLLGVGLFTLVLVFVGPGLVKRLRGRRTLLRQRPIRA
jgi:hypothetical protein